MNLRQEIFIAARYFKARHENAFIVIVSRLSMAGVVPGVAALVAAPGGIVAGPIRRCAVAPGVAALVAAPAPMNGLAGTAGVAVAAFGSIPAP